MAKHESKVSPLDEHTKMRITRVITDEGSMQKAGDALLVGRGTLSNVLKKGCGPHLKRRLYAALTAWEQGKGPKQQAPLPPSPTFTVPPILAALAQGSTDPNVSATLDRIEAKLDALLAAWGVKL